MSQTEEQRRALREMLKRLRVERAAFVEKATEANKRRRAVRAAIRGELDKGPATVPALAAACGLLSSEVLWHMAAMRKYGELVEAVQDGDYFTYRLSPPKGEG
jgi:hypothetical protein